jgi:hypothetical protein
MAHSAAPEIFKVFFSSSPLFLLYAKSDLIQNIAWPVQAYRRLFKALLQKK